MTRSEYCGPFFASHLGNVFQWTGEELSQEAGNAYSDQIAESQERKVYFLFPRIPGRFQYLAALDESVRKCLRSQSSAQKTLDRVAERWETITESFGRNEQTRELRLNHGI